MASTLRWAFYSAAILAALIITTGCQPNSKAVVARNLPAPSFDGPRINHAAPSHDSLAVVPPSGPSSWRPTVAPRAWRWIVIHHSASDTGSMTLFDKEHRAKGWDGVGYHFVIGNGTGSGDGQIEVTPRWPIQKWGAHAKTLDNRYNEYGIGICLVGNFDSSRPTAKQMESLSSLVAYLMQTYRIPATNVLGHRDTKPTDCPGRNLDIAAVRSAASRNLANAATTSDPPVAARAQVARTELLHGRD
jgi:hypothetical protein